MTTSDYTFIAAAMMHIEGYYSIFSLAWKNNNPGNIEDSNGHFIAYPDKNTGYRALVQDIAANQGKTLAHFIAKYAPPTENNTSEYLELVCKLTGFKESDVL